jgi:hypothetical protein
MAAGYNQDRWEDLQMLFSARNQGAAAAVLANYNSTGIYVWRYTDGKELFFTAQVSHAWNRLTLKPHVHWVPDTTETYTGTWDMDYVWCNPNTGAIVSAKQSISGAISGAKTAYTEQTTDITDINLASPMVSALLMIRLGLTLSAGTGAFLFGFDMHYQRARPGTINPNTDP